LELLDARAHRAIEGGNLPRTVRLRNLMAAIHAIINDDVEKWEPRQ
jgi:hypothetical protein